MEFMRILAVPSKWNANGMQTPPIPGWLEPQLQTVESKYWQSDTAAERWLDE